MSFGYNSPPSTSELDSDVQSLVGCDMQADAAGVNAYRLVHNSINPDQVGEADMTDPTKMPIFGIVVVAIMPLARGQVVKRGKVENPAWNWIPNKPLFAGINGNLQQTLPVAPNTVHKVGWAITPTKIYFELGSHIKREI